MIQLGIFDLLDPIARGGMGEVWRGRHQDSGVDAAIKVILESNEETRLRFEREVRAHAGLNHPGVCMLFDYGTIDEQAGKASNYRLQPGSPYLAMEYADGGTLRGRPPHDWPTLHHTITSILDALSHAHARGVTHRDLKPENMLLMGSDPFQIKLSDFGIAHAHGKENEDTLHELSSVTGTPHYMAPEQIHGHWRFYGPWTDIYALGCIVWEWTCGLPAFDHPKLVPLLHSHFGPRPSLRPIFEIPDSLETWIHTAMHVRADQRFQSAAHALNALAPLDDRYGTRPTYSLTTLAQPTLVSQDPTISFLRRTNGEAETVDNQTLDLSISKTLIKRAHTPVHVPKLRVPHRWQLENVSAPAPLVGAGLGLFGLREIPFVDRDQARDTIWETLRRVVEDGEFRVVLIVGGAGSGKSTLARWMACRAEEVGVARRYEAIHRAGAPGEVDGIVGMMRRAFRSWKLEREELFQMVSADLLDQNNDFFSEADAHALTEWLSPRWSEGKKVTGPRFRLSSARQRHNLAHRLLIRMSSVQPSFMVLDDLQWGGETLDVLEYIVHSSTPTPQTLVVGTIRADLLDENAELKARFDAIFDQPNTYRIDLGPLQEEDQSVLLNRMLGLEEDVLRFLAERTEGNPLFATQLLRHLIDRDLLETGITGFQLKPGAEQSLPHDIFDLWVGRIDRLVESFPPEVARPIRWALELAATLGKQVDTDEWQLACEVRGLDVSPNLVGRIVARGLGHETPNGWEFTHGMLVDSLCEQATLAGNSKDHHRACAQALRRIATQTGRPTADRESEHWLQSGDLEAALAPLLEASHVSFERGEYTQWKTTLNRHQDLLDRLGRGPLDPERLESELLLAKVLYTERKTDEGIARAESALKACQESGIDLLIIKAHSQLGVSLISAGNFERAREELGKGLALSEKTGEQYWQGKILHREANSWYVSGEYQKAEACYRRALRALRQTDSKYDELLSEAWYGWTLLALGEWEQADNVLKHALQGAVSHRYRSIEGHCLNGIGDVARFSGDASGARDAYQGAYRIELELGDNVGAATIQMNLAQTELALENWEEARKLLEASIVKDLYPQLLASARIALASGTGDWAELSKRLDDLTELKAQGTVPEDLVWLLELARGYAEATQPTLAAHLQSLIDELREDDQSVAT